ncbi:MAG: NusG domain II-containing protein [Caldisericia bacterium]|nr:NusG domain II-containing protein [Caldisericia bacterium]
MKKIDKFIFYLLIPLLIFSIFYLSFDTQNKTLVVLDKNGENEFNLFQKRVIFCEGNNGKVLVLIDNGKARVIESNCKDKICIRKGWISSIGEYSICLPNEVFIIIKGRGKIDGISE